MSGLRLDEKGIVNACPSCGQKNRVWFERLGRSVRCAACKVELSPPSEPVEIGRVADFDALIASAAIPLVVDYWAPWCGPCHMVAREIEKVAAANRGHFLVAKIDTEALPELAQRFSIRSIPTMAVFFDGREIARTAGARPAADIEAFVSGALGDHRAAG